nr:unnamed protein product [Callosobruchus chinensis]
MHLPQIRSLGLYPASRRNVRNGAKYNQREDLRSSLVLVPFPLHHLSRSSIVEVPHSGTTCQKCAVQQDGICHLLPWKTESLGYADHHQVRKLVSSLQHEFSNFSRRDILVFRLCL